MAKLSEEEAAQLKALQDKAEAPDDDEGGRRGVNFVVDLSDEGAIKRALKLGFLKPEDLEDDDGGAGDDDGKGDDDKGDGKPQRKPDRSPRRRGYFPSGGDE